MPVQRKAAKSVYAKSRAMKEGASKNILSTTSRGTHAAPREVLLEWHREATGAVYDASGPRGTVLR